MPEKRILFVDDELNVIEGLRRMLRKQRQEWEMEFVSSGQEALAALAQKRFDVIVSDMRMPSMDGAELLEKVKQAYPNVARIMLSGHVDEASANLAVKLAHRYLSKPTDAETLKEAVRQVCLTQQLVGNNRVRGMIGGCTTLPSLPDTYLEIERVLSSEDSNASSVAEVISRDMAMSAKILQLVNSSFFGVGRRVSSVKETVTLLGFTRIKALVLSEHVFEQFKPAEPIEGFSIEGLWQHSSLVAETARLISRQEGQKGDRPDQAFMAGLLHDVGILAFAWQNPDGFREVMREARETDRDALEIEQESCGVSHGEVGAYLLGLWGLPPRIVEAVARHHDPSRVSYEGLCALTAVHAADALVSEVGEPESSMYGYSALAELDGTYLARIGMTEHLAGWRELANRACDTEVVAQT